MSFQTGLQTRRLLGRVAALLVVAAVVGCGGESVGEAADGELATDDSPADRPGGALTGLLADGNPIFGIFSGEKTREQGAMMAQNRSTDFVFYSLETGPFDLDQMAEYVAGMAEGTGDLPAHPIALRIPPLRDGMDAGLERVRQAVEAGVEAVVFPHVETAEEARQAVQAMGPNAWPGNPNGNVMAILIVEDREAIEVAEEIAAVPGIGVLIPGPGDLRRSYEGDMEAVEAAIQRVLAACQANGITCGITAGVDDIGTRLDQGFGTIIVTQPEALDVGLQASGRAEH